MKELIEYIARSIVDSPDEVTVTEVPAEDGIILRLQVAPDDTGKVIGKEGRIAKAMRTLLRVAAIRKGTRATLEIISDVEAPRSSPEPRGYDSGSIPEPDSGPEPDTSREPDSIRRWASSRKPRSSATASGGASSPGAGCCAKAGSATIRVKNRVAAREI